MKDKLYKEFLSKRKEEIIELKKQLGFYKQQFDALLDDNSPLDEISFNLDNQRSVCELLHLKEIEYSVLKAKLREANNYLIKVKLESKRAIEEYKREIIENKDNKKFNPQDFYDAPPLTKDKLKHIGEIK